MTVVNVSPAPDTTEEVKPAPPRRPYGRSGRATKLMTYRIVVGVDGSRHRRSRAQVVGRGNREARSGELVAVFAWQVPFVSIPGTFDRGELRQATKELLIETVSRVIPTAPIPLRTLVAEGDPAAALVEASKSADLLAVGTRGRSPWAGLLLGSVSQRCAAGARSRSS